MNHNCGKLRLILAVLVVLNLAAFVWIRTLPRADAILSGVLAQDAQTNTGALSAQVAAGKTYQDLYAKHASATTVLLWLVLLNGALCFLQVIFLTARKQLAITQPDTEHGAQADAPNRAP